MSRLLPQTEIHSHVFLLEGRTWSFHLDPQIYDDNQTDTFAIRMEYLKKLGYVICRV